MNVDLKDIPGRTAGAVTGAVVELGDAAAHPGEVTVKRLRRLEAKGEPVNRRIVREAARLPEKVVTQSLRMVAARARRRDLVGEAAYRWLELVHEGLDNSVGSLTRIQQAAQPPARAGLNRATKTPIRQAANRSATKARTNARRTTRRTTSRVRATG